MNISRADRLAMSFALEYLRRSKRNTSHVRSLLLLGGEVSREIERHMNGSRAGRARLALLLRVLLRVADYDFGPTVVRDCVPQSYRVWCNTAPMRPLWEQAPPHTVPARRRRRAA